jgi:peptidoglycan/LPS O-acetylase OafA/YrhL
MTAGDFRVPAPRAANLAPLTSLRFFAAAAIVLLHSTGSLVPGTRDAALGLGVSFFFVLSGFILSHVYGRMATTSSADYLRNRIARIWPLHAVTFLIALLPMGLAALGDARVQQAALINLFLLEAWVPVVGMPPFNGVSWSISAELGFYLLFPLLARARRQWLGVAAIAAVYVVAFAWLDAVAPTAHPGRWQFGTNDFLMHHPLMRCLEFAVGVAVQRSFHNDGFAARINRLPTAWELGALAAVLAFGVVSQNPLRGSTAEWNPHVGRWLAQSGGMLFFAAFILVMAVSRGRLARALGNRWLVLLGEISFATYMVHQLILKAVVKNGLGAELAWPVRAALTFAAIYVASYLLWRFVEVPSRKLLGTGGKARGRSADAAARAERPLSADGPPAPALPPA